MKLIEKTDKLVQKNGVDHVELRYNCGGVNILVIVATKGWHFKNETARDLKHPNWESQNTHQFNVRFSMNGPLLTTFAGFDNLMKTIEEDIEEAKEFLKFSNAVAI